MRMDDHDGLLVGPITLTHDEMDWVWVGGIAEQKKMCIAFGIVKNNELVSNLSALY